MFNVIYVGDDAYLNSSHAIFQLIELRVFFLFSQSKIVYNLCVY